MQFSSASRQTGFTSKRVLLVERSRTIQTLLAIYLRNAGHQVLVCSTPQEALQLLANLLQAPECIVMAVHAPEQDDYRFIHTIKGRTPDAGVHLVALVLQEEMAEVQRRLKEVRVSYLGKPFRSHSGRAGTGCSACRGQWRPSRYLTCPISCRDRGWMWRGHVGLVPVLRAEAIRLA